MRDIDVRSAMLRRLRDSHADDASTRIVEEMGIWSGTVRVDIAVINGELSGVELKSDRDTLERLPSQAALYSRVFDRMTLVVGSKHIEKALPLIPTWWGVIAATWNGQEVELEDVRKVDKNPKPDAFLLAQLLWKDEALLVLEARGLAKGWKSKTAAAVHHHLAASLPIVDLSGSVRAALKARSVWLR
ncbi:MULTISPECIES: sce7726 family protein [unclassified Rhizobium]|uniref:sce7726 family protein n=1 Tax=unclassified Rhizobium TaxID=2613769 RepID=UPI001ADC700A|nr:MULTISPECIES: sce7726 family protein [unclassified Rhizobium]MBO9100014.1 sce7726 family protein [Rhizobium sp. L58/93]QXZ82825.1 sce7726 family protein [Rhizobium sp. K1/93]QXZ89662.1 sce7726 family protein [Rhizobium sp. K15/93]